MKIIYSGAFHKESTNYSQARELAKICDLVEYPCKVIAAKVGPTERDQDLIDTVYKERPDVLLFAKGTGISLDVIKECNKVTKTCIWWMDAYPHGNWDTEHVEKLKHASFVCCDKVAAVNEALKYNKRVFKLTEGYDSVVDKPVHVLKDKDVSFIGGIYGARASICNSVNAMIHTNAFNEEHARIVCSSKINLSVSTHRCHSDRVYKIMGAAGFLLSDDWDGREFIDGVHLVIFDGIRDLQAKVEYYLEHPENRYSIAARGYKEVQKYTRAQWADNLIRIYNSIDF